MDMYTCERLVGCPAAIASKPAPTGLIGVHLREIGRLSGRHRGQARLPQLDCVHLREIGRLPGRQDQKIAAFGSSEGKGDQSANQPFSQYRTLSPRSM